MYSVLKRSAILLSILTSLPLANASAELKKVPLILMDHGTFDFQGENIPIADLEGDGTSTHLGKIESIGVFESLGPGPPGRFKGKIEGTATAVPLDEMGTPAATATANATAAATPSPSPTPTPDTITYRLSAEFFPGGVQGIFYGVGTYRITGGTGKFKGARGFGEFVGLADLRDGGPLAYNCFLRGVISY